MATTPTWSTYRPQVHHKGPTDNEGNPIHRLSDSFSTRKSLLGKRNQRAMTARGQELIARHRANQAKTPRKPQACIRCMAKLGRANFRNHTLLRASQLDLILPNSTLSRTISCH